MSSVNPEYGKVIVETGYRKGELASTITTVMRSISVHNKQELLTSIIEQLDNLRQVNSIGFEVHADVHTHEPVRIVVTSKEIS